MMMYGALKLSKEVPFENVSVFCLNDFHLFSVKFRILRGGGAVK